MDETRNKRFTRKGEEKEHWRKITRGTGLRTHKSQDMDDIIGFRFEGHYITLQRCFLV